MVRALRHRNFRLFFFGQLLSLPGTWIQAVAQSWLIYRLTDSAALLGLAGFASQFPVFLMAPLGGALADRFSRHRLLIATQIASAVLALVLAALTLSGAVQVWQVFGLAALLGVVNGFDLPARQAFTVQLVGRADLPNAIALNSSAFNAARLIGPAVAGVLVAATGEGWCFLLNAVSYATVLVALLAMRLEPVSRPVQAGSILAHIVDGVSYVRGHLPIRSLLLLLGMVSLAGMPYAVLMPLFADRILGGGAQGLGILMSCAGWWRAGRGAAAGGPPRPRRSGRLGAVGGVRVRAGSDRLLAIAQFLAIGRTAGAHRLCDDGADGRLQHAAADDGARRPARAGDVALFDDVHGHGAGRRAAGRRPGGCHRRAADRRRWRRAVHARGVLVSASSAQDSRRGAQPE